MTNFVFLDKRIQSTKIKLIKAFFELFPNSKYENITVKKILTQANVSRKAFYSHYNNKHELVEDIIRILFEELTILFREPYFDKTELHIDDLKGYRFNALAYFKKNHKYLKALLHENLPFSFKEQLTIQLITLYEKDFEHSGSPTKNTFKQKYVVYGSIGIIIEWIEQDCPVDISELSNLLVEIVTEPLKTIQLKQKRAPKKVNSAFPEL